MSPNLGDFAVVHVTGTVGWFIRFGQWINGNGFSDFEHAFVYVGNNKIVEAEPGGAKLNDLSRYDGRRIAWYSAPIDKREDIAYHARLLIGVKYSFLDYLSIALLRLKIFAPRYGWVAYLLRDYVASTGHLICSQLVDASYLNAGASLFADGRFTGDVTPANLYKLILEQNGELE